MLGHSLRSIAAQFGAAIGGVRRHSNNCMASIEASRAEVQTIRQRSIIELVRNSISKMEALRDSAIDSSPEPDALGAQKELTRLYELEARMTGQLVPKTSSAPQFSSAREMLEYTKRMIPLLEAQAAEEDIDMPEELKE